MTRRARPLTAEDEQFFAGFTSLLPAPAPLEPGARVLITGADHPWKGCTGTVREVQPLQQLFGGGIGYAVELDGKAGHRAGCRRAELTLVDELVQRTPRGRRASR